MLAYLRTSLLHSKIAAASSLPPNCACVIARLEIRQSLQGLIAKENLVPSVTFLSLEAMKHQIRRMPPRTLPPAHSHSLPPCARDNRFQLTGWAPLLPVYCACEALY